VEVQAERMFLLKFEVSMVPTTPDEFEVVVLLALPQNHAT